MKMKNLKLFCLALSGFLSMSSMSGCNPVSPNYYKENGCEFTRQFDIGEHIISVPLKDDISKKPMQIEAHSGYEVEGISICTYGDLFSFYGGGVIVYSNDEVVECSSNLYDDNGEYVYLDFGTPLNYEENNTVSNGSVCEFDVGEHIISIPINYDVRKTSAQYEYHEGYEVVGITVASYGNLADSYGGGAVLYKNNVPVRAEYQEDGYTTFGEPIVKEQRRGLN